MIQLVLFLLFLSIPASGETLPEWFIPLREAIYEQNLKADEIAPIYLEISNRAKSSLSGSEQYIVLSRCEYMMGRAYQFEEKKNEAASHYSEGISYAEKALELQKSAAAYIMLAENISQSCAVRSVSYAMANGLKVERYAKSALEIDSRNAAARYLIAARWVYAPSPFNNYRKGIEMLNAIPGESDMEKDDMFNIYSALGYIYIQQKNKSQAQIWLLKSLEIYPTNKYVQSLSAQL